MGEPTVGWTYEELADKYEDEVRAHHAERAAHANTQRFCKEQLAQAAHDEADTRRRLEEAERAAYSMSVNADRHADEYAELEQRLTATQAAARALIAEMQAHADVYGCRRSRR